MWLNIEEQEISTHACELFVFLLWISYIWTFLFCSDLFIYFKGTPTETEGETEKQRTSSHWFTPQKAATPRAEARN